MAKLEFDYAQPNHKVIFEAISETLFQNGLNYDSSSEELIDVGKHISIRLIDLGNHDQAIELHFRRNTTDKDGEKMAENLKGLKDISRAKQFSQNIGQDLYKLAYLLRFDEKFKNVTTLCGLTHLGAAWGRRHGFLTELYSKDRNKINQHLDSIPEFKNLAPEKRQIFQKLTFFFYSAKKFTTHYLYRACLP